MKHIQPQNVRYVYFTPDDDISKLASLLDAEPAWPSAFMQEHWNAFPDVRLVGAPSLHTHELPLYWLYWDDGTDLRALDARVEAGTYTDADFEESIKTQYSRNTCFSCNREWDSLIIPPGDPYLGAPELYERKLAAWWPKMKKCPACGAAQRQMVVKIFGQHGRK